ncbi:MAG: DUF5067 domain-containing protein [Bifidobacterium psychraerophilum]|uniref:DUF5067 domain-containing protein n=1 Tax=Bifidobacterium psychraerophilum TaxID=218140 RepID=UPI0039EAF9BF
MTAPVFNSPQPPQRHNTPKKGITVSGIIALVLGILSLLICYIPILNNGSVILGVIGAIFGIVAVVATRSKGKKSGKVIAILGLVLSVVSVIAALALQSAWSKALDAATAGPTSSATASAKADESTSASSAADEADLSAGHVKVVSMQKAANDYEGKPTVIVTYEWTNTGSDTMFMSAFDFKAFQNGTSLDTAIYTDNPQGYDGEAQMKTIKKGVKQTVQVAYVLSDQTSPVSVEVSDLFGGSNKITKEFTL